MSYLIVGATKGLGLDLAYEFAKNSKPVFRESSRCVIKCAQIYSPLECSNETC